MKKLIAGLTLFFALAASVMVDAGMVIGSGAGGGGATLIFEEEAEGAGTPAGWTNTGTPDWDYTGVVLAGAQSVQAADGERVGFDSGSAYSEVFLRFRFRIESGGDTGYRVFSFRNQSGDSEIAYMEVAAGGEARVVSGGASATTADLLTTPCGPASCVFWVRYKAGTGSNAEMSVGFSEDCTEPTSGARFAALTTGTSTASINRFQFRAGPGGTSVFLFDSLAADDAALGDC